MSLSNEAFRIAWTLLEQRWGSRGSELAAFYLAALDHLTDEQLEANVRDVLINDEYFPPVKRLMGRKTSSAAEAWEDLAPLLRDTSQGIGRLSVPARRAVLAMGGLRAIGERNADLPFRRREFMDLYQHYAEATERDELPPITEAGRALVRDAMSGNLTRQIGGGER